MKLNPNKLGISLAIGAAVAACINMAFIVLLVGSTIGDFFNPLLLKNVGITLVSTYVLGYVTGYLYNTLK